MKPNKKQQNLASNWYLEAMESLIEVVQELSQAKDLDTVMAIVRVAARRLTNADGATFVLRDNDKCYYAEENAISPLWKGQRFPITQCVSGWAMINRAPAVIEDIYNDPRVPADAYRPTFVKSLAMVPIRKENPIGAIGNYWATKRKPTEEEVYILQALANTTSVALENVQLYDELQKKVIRLQEQQTRITEQHESLEVFTRALAHDLKEPVRTMQSFIGLVSQPQQTPEKVKKYNEYIKTAADRMSALIDAVFRYTQLDDSEQIVKNQCSMQSIVDSVKANLSDLIDEKEAVVLSGSLPNIYVDPERIMVVMQNLIANAIQHGKKGITVNIKFEEQPDKLLFTVSDNGLGIANEYLTKVFQPFKRLMNNPEHLGLGLAVCRKIIESHYGKIWCTSEKNKGTDFHFTLPKEVLISPNSNLTEKANDSDKETGDSSRLANILVVDDSESDIELTKVLLTEVAKVGCNLILALNGQQALEMLRKSIKNTNKIDFLLVDINMPGMDGFELIERINKEEDLKHMPVIMCSGSTYIRDKQRADSLGVAGYLVKPPAFDKLRSILETIPTLKIRENDDSYFIYKNE